MKLMGAHHSPLVWAKFSRHCIAALVVVLSIFGVSAGQNPASRPILFAHGFCGSAFDFQPLLAPLYQQLPSSLYPSSTIYYVISDTIQDTVTFFTVSNGQLQPVPESSIPPSTRFFSIIFYDPVGQDIDVSNVAKISVLNKGYEISQAVKHIAAITHIKDVIVIAHSMGGLDARAYVENLASQGQCYDYQNNVPAYSAPSCSPGTGGAAFAGDVGDIVTVDTPHLGSPLASLSFSELGVLSGEIACIAAPSVNRTELELQPLGGSGLIESLNYGGSAIGGVEPEKNVTSIQAVEDYFDDVTEAWDLLTGYSDDIVQQPSQSIVLNLPKSDSSAPLKDISEAYSSSDPGIVGTADCWLGSVVRFSMLHFMTCLGAQPDTQSAIASQVIANDAGTLTSITVNAIYNGNTWSGPVSYQISGPNGIESESNVPASVTDVPLGTYSVAYLSGGPQSNGPPTIIANPGPTLQSGQWAITFTLQFSSQNSSVTTLPASSITSDSAVLNGTVNPEGSPGSVYFFWGTSPANLGNGCSLGPVQPTYITQSFSCTAGDLLSNTTYYFQFAFVDNNNGVWTYGSTLTFFVPVPALITKKATSITSDSAVLNGTINPNGSPGAVFFFWGTSPTNLGNECSLGPVQPTYTTQPFSCTAGDLLVQHNLLLPTHVRG